MVDFEGHSGAMPDPQYWTVAGFKTLPEMQASIEHCTEVVRYQSSRGCC
jgi:hypothetical protein